MNNLNDKNGISVKFAVQYEATSRHYNKQLNKDISMKELKDIFLKDFDLDLQFTYNDIELIIYVKDGDPFYLKQETISYLSKAYMIILCKERSKEIGELKRHINSRDHDNMVSSLECLTERLRVNGFLEECINHNLHDDIFKLSDTVMQNCSDDRLAELTISVLNELCFSNKVDQDAPSAGPYVSWMHIKIELILQILNFANRSNDIKAIDPALKVLVGYVKNNFQKRAEVLNRIDEKFISNLFLKFPNFTEKKRKCSIQISMTSLLNILFSSIKTKKDEYFHQLKNYLGDGKMRNFKEKIDLLNRSLKEFPSGMSPQGYNEPTKEENELITQLIRLQYNILLPVYLDIPFDNLYRGPQLQHIDNVKFLMLTDDNTRDSEIYEKFGFKNIENPSLDFRCDKGKITFDCIYHMAKIYPNETTQILSRINLNSQFKFIPACFSLVNVLDRVLQIVAVNDGNASGIYLPMLFENCEITDSCLSKQFFYELFYQSFLAYTEHLTESTVENLEDLEEFFINQLNEVLACYPVSLEVFSVWLLKSKTENLFKKKLEAQVREWEDNSSNGNPIIKKLQQELNTDYKAIVSQKRIKQIQTKRFSFSFGNSRSKDQQKYNFQLDCSKSVINVTVPSDDNNPQYKWVISHIREIVINEKCPHWKKLPDTYFFTIRMETNQEDGKLDASQNSSSQMKPFNFWSNNKAEFNIWVDGLNILMNRPDLSQDFFDEVRTLVRMEMKIRFLLITKETIPNTPPPIPPMPADYDFCD